MNNYTQQAINFAKVNKVLLKVNSVNYGKHFIDDKQERYIFSLTLKVNKRNYTFKFGQSINAGSQEPTMYDVFTCLQKYDVGSFENFCSEFGYDEDSRKAEKTYKAVCKEYEAVCRIFTTEQIEQLQEIQ